jgi:hypothetical protein
MPSEYQNATVRPASLEEEVRTVIEEARMVLPGIQAFFGFQLIAVFNNRFQELTHTEQVLHLIALLLLAVSIALIMAPAAYHRIAERGMVSRHFVELASRFLECAMFPLMLSITVGLFLLTRLILNNSALSTAVAVGAILMFFVLWYLFPWTQSARAKRRHGSSPGAKKN